MIDAQFQVICPGCGKTSVYSLDMARTVQECAECGGWVGVPETTDDGRISDESFDGRTQEFDIAHRARRAEEYQPELAEENERHDRNAEMVEKLAALIGARRFLTLKMFLGGLFVGLVIAGFGSPNGIWIGALVGAILGLFFGLVIEIGNAATQRLRGKRRKPPPSEPPISN